MKGGHIQLKQGKSEEVEKDIKVENQCTVFRHCVCFSPQVQTMVRSQRRLGSTCWEFMAEALRLQWDRRWPRLTQTPFMERGRLRQRREHFEIKRGWSLYTLLHYCAKLLRPMFLNFLKVIFSSSSLAFHSFWVQSSYLTIFRENLLFIFKNQF